MLEMPTCVTEKQYRLAKKERENKMLYGFLCRANIELKEGKPKYFDLPSDKYIGMVDDARKYFEDNGWMTDVNASKSTIFLEYDKNTNKGE